MQAFSKNLPGQFRIPLLGFFLVSVLCFTLITSWGHLALSQVPSQKDLQEFYRNQGINSPLNAQGAIGNLAYAPVKLDGKVLFLVAAPAALSQKKEGEGLSPVEVRVQSIEQKLHGILQRGFDPKTLVVNASILNGQTVILVSDGKQLTPQPVLTLTELDVQLHGRALSDLAANGSIYLRNALLEAWEQRQSDYLRRQGSIAGAISLGLLLTTGLWQRLQRVLKTRWQQYKEQLTHLRLFEAAEQSSVQSVLKPDFLTNTNQKTEIIERTTNRENLRAKIQRLTFELLLVDFGVIFLWLICISQILQLFPYTRELGFFIAQKPRELLSIWLVVFLVNKAADPLVSRLLKGWKEEAEAKILFSQASERILVRIDTLADVVKVIITVLSLAFGLIISLQSLGVPITPVLAGAGIVGFAISFGSQNFIKSLISGVSNLWLDAYAVGDFIVVENVSGTVEKMNLFFTQIRNLEGSLITIPNSHIEIVENKTRDWSQVNLTIQVAYDTDVDKALITVRETAEELSQDPDWQQHILESPNLLGVDNLEHSGMEVRLLLKTQPGLQWKVGRELRRRLRQRFEREGISIGIPQQTLAVAASNQKLVDRH